MNIAPEFLAKELIKHFDYVNKLDAIRFLIGRFHPKPSLKECCDAWEIAKDYWTYN